MYRRSITVIVLCGITSLAVHLRSRLNTWVAIGSILSSRQRLVPSYAFSSPECRSCESGSEDGILK